MESQTQNPEFRINPETFTHVNITNEPEHKILVLSNCRATKVQVSLCKCKKLARALAACIH